MRVLFADTAHAVLLALAAVGSQAWLRDVSKALTAQYKHYEKEPTVAVRSHLFFRDELFAF